MLETAGNEDYEIIKVEGKEGEEKETKKDNKVAGGGEVLATREGTRNKTKSLCRSDMTQRKNDKDGIKDDSQHS